MRALPVVILVLAGCRYSSDIGGPDNDGDQYGELVDCDDSNADVNPGVSEVAYNGVDDDCDPDTPDDDLDGDGFDAAEDCDDAQASVNPDADEACNGVDDDCDESVDEALGGLWYEDDDEDGFGDQSSAQQTCTPDAGMVDVGGDCDDGDSAINPAADEQCDNVDHDCDGFTDVDVPDAPVWYLDADSDTWGDPDEVVTACTQPSGYVDRAGDCDDDPTTGGMTFPGADEVCDDRDNDCDLAIDDDPVDPTTWHYNGDGDNYGSDVLTVDLCDAPTGFLSTGGDCDDSNADVYPDAPEICDGVANDCNQPNVVDEGATDAITWYADLDGDGWGDPASSTDACEAPAEHVANDLDCDDDAVDGALSEPGGVEVCDDGFDNDCDGTVDNAFDASVWFEDLDDDTYGNPSEWLWACDQPVGYTDNPDDCDDNETTGATINPDATESCNSIDDDCNGLIDDGATGGDTWYADRDGDTYGDDLTAVMACTQPSPLYVMDGGDCDDDDAAFNPDATDTCDGLDRNCTGANDFDADGDGYIGTGGGCDVDDCNDGDENIYPGTGGCSAGESCLDAMLSWGFDADGFYFIDGDPGGNPDPREVYCDMTDDGDRPGAGWTRIALHTFTGGTASWTSSEGSTSQVTCDDDIRLGRNDEDHHNGYVTRTFDAVGVPHTDWWVDLEYVFVDNWEGDPFDEYGWLEIDEQWLWWGVYDEPNDPGPSDICGSSNEDLIDEIHEGKFDPDDFITVRVGAELSANDEGFLIDDVMVWVR